MKNRLFLIYVFIGISLLYACDGAYSPVVEMTLESGEVVKGHLHMDACQGDAQTIILSENSMENLKNYDLILPDKKYAKDNNLSYTLYTKTVRLPWAYFYIAESVRYISPDSVKKITYQSEFEGSEFKKFGAWYAISQVNYDKIQKGVYGFIIIPKELSDFIYLRMNENISKNEFVLYTFLTSYYSWDYSNIESDFPFINSRKKEIRDKEFLNNLSTLTLNEGLISNIDFYKMNLEKYLPLINQNKILKEESKKAMTKSIQKAVQNIILFKKVLLNHQNILITEIPVKDIPKELIPLAKSSKIASNFYIRLAEQIINPTFFSNNEINTVENEDRILDELGIIILPLVDSMED